MMLSLFSTKIIWCSVIFILNSFGTIAAFVFTRKRCSSQRLPSSLITTLSYANCFSVGLFLSVCLTGLYNSSTEKITTFQQSLRESNPFHSYPVSEALLCVGFFLLWFLECLFHSIFPGAETLDHPKFAYAQDSVQPPLDVEVISLDEDGDRAALLSEWDTPTDQPSTKATTLRAKLARNASVSGSFLRSLFLITAMSMHTILETLGFGMLDTFPQVLSMAVAMGLHQFVCSSTLGLRLAQVPTTVSRYRCTLAILTAYLLLLPLGVLIGCSVHSYQSTSTSCNQLNTTCPSNLSESAVQISLSGHLVMGVLQNFAAATFLYVVFVEILPGEIPGRASASTCISELSDGSTRSSKQRLLCCFCAFFGFVLTSSLRFIRHG